MFPIKLVGVSMENNLRGNLYRSLTIVTRVYFKCGTSFWKQKLTGRQKPDPVHKQKILFP